HAALHLLRLLRRSLPGRRDSSWARVRAGGFRSPRLRLHQRYAARPREIRAAAPVPPRCRPAGSRAPPRDPRVRRPRRGLSPPPAAESRLVMQSQFVPLLLGCAVALLSALGVLLARRPIYAAMAL